jgi:hypothetical protein
MRNKHSVRILLDPALDHAVTSLARTESRAVANVCLVLIKEALASRRRAEQCPAERTEPSPS